jgi:hypothetical protein
MSAHGDSHAQVASLLRDNGPLAPPGLRARIDQERARAGERSGLLAAPLRANLAPAIGLAAVLVALAVVLPLAFKGEPTALDAHALITRGAASPAPEPQAGSPELLAAQIDGVTFPRWEEEFGWRAFGSRSDEIDGRETKTVFYTHEGHDIAYTVVSGAPLEAPEGATSREVNGVDLKQYSDDHGHDIVVFERGGHTCVLSGHVEHRSTLVELASWQGDGRVTF